MDAEAIKNALGSRRLTRISPQAAKQLASSTSRDVMTHLEQTPFGAFEARCAATAPRREPYGAL
jgi:hypothetical protein